MPGLFKTVLLTIPLLVVLVHSTGFAGDNRAELEQKIQTTAEQLEQLDKELNSSKADKARLEAAFKKAQSNVGERKQRADQLEAEIQRYTTSLKRLQNQLQELQNTVDAHQLSLSNAMKNAQTLAQQTPLKITLQHSDPALSSRLKIYTEVLLSAQLRLIEEQLSDLQRIKTAEATALKDRNWLNYIQKKALAQRENYLLVANETQSNIQDVDTRIDSTTRTVAQLRADQKRLMTLLEELTRQQGAESGYFISGKGEYPYPVNGLVKTQFGDTKSVGKLTWQGIFLEAAPGNKVTAIADGEILYSGWLQGFGQLVIIDHGDNFTSLYGGNRETLLAPGDWVEAGATIATVGNSGGQTVSGLYFEIRQHAKALDPESWLRRPARL